MAGRTDGMGTVEGLFRAAAARGQGKSQMMMGALVNRQRRVLQQPIYVGRVANVLLSTDKPVYQPGQTIHMRSLALDALDLHAADGETVTFTVTDPQGNKLTRSEVAASRYGLASPDLAPGTPAPHGAQNPTDRARPTRNHHTARRRRRKR